MNGIEQLLCLLKQRLFYVIIALIYVVNWAMSYNEKFNVDKVNEYYSTFGAYGTHVEERIDADELIAFAKAQLGKPYHPSGKGPNAFDCSGFTQYVFKRFNIYLPASARSQASAGRHVEVDELQPGDLVFFKGSNIKNKAVGHVGIVTERTDEEIKFIHSSTSSGIMINDLLQDAYYVMRYKGAQRVTDS